MTRTDTAQINTTPTSDDATDMVTLWAAYLLLAVAFGFSYSHVVDAVRAWGQPEIAAYGIAAMPEVTVFIGMRKLLAGQGSKFVIFVLATAGAFTLAGNLHSAQHTVGGYVAAGWPAYSAVTALVLSGIHGKKKTSVTSEQTRTIAEVRIGRERTTTSAPATPRVSAPRVTPATVTPVVAEVVTPKAITATRTPQGQGHDAVTAWLTSNWSPAAPLDKDVKAAAMAATGVSEPTVKRAARALKLSIQTETDK